VKWRGPGRPQRTDAASMAAGRSPFVPSAERPISARPAGPASSTTRVPRRSSRHEGGAQLTRRQRALPGAVELHGVAVHPAHGGRSSAPRAGLPRHALAHESHSSASTGRAAGTRAHDERPVRAGPRPVPYSIRWPAPEVQNASSTAAIDGADGSQDGATVRGSRCRRPPRPGPAPSRCGPGCAC